MRKTIATLAALAALALPTTASGALAEDFRLIPINGPGQPPVPALPGESNYFWAGACETALAPGLEAPIPGGIGSRPASTLGAVAGFFGGQVGTVPAPALPAHCIDPGGASPLGSETWAIPPAWRLPAQAQAGAHPDGTAAFAFEKGVDGALDNIVVELPAGFVGDPNAIAKCSAEQFAVRPQQCPPSSQVGVLDINLFAAGITGNVGNQNLHVLPVFNLEPRQGNAAELGLVYLSTEGKVTARLVAKARTNGDFGVTTFIGQIPAALPLHAQTITIWGVPWAAENDLWRAPAGFSEGGGPCNSIAGAGGDNVGRGIPSSGLAPNCRQHYDPSWGPIRPFVSSITECDPTAPSTRLAIDAFQRPGAFISDGRPGSAGTVDSRNGDPDYSDPDWKTYTSLADPVSGCEKLGFDPAIALDPTGPGGAAVRSADSPTGLDVELEIPQNDELPFPAPPEGSEQSLVDTYLADAAAYWRSDAGLASSHLKDTVVTLPEGLSLNPSSADGLGVCSMAQIGVTDTDSPEPPAIRFDNGAVECPDSSKIAEVVVETPLLEEADWPTGNVYLAKQGDNPFGSDFAIYIAVESPERGVIVKLAGEVTPDPATGRLTTAFVQNPQLPFDRFNLRFKGGPRAPLATPVTCGTHTNATALTPYSDPGDPVTVDDPFEITNAPAGGCPTSKGSRPFELGFSAGSTEILAGAHSPFTVRITRGDGNQELDRVEVTTPEGFAAKLAGVAQCSDAAIAQAQGRTATGDGALEQSSPSCPDSARIGTTTIGAGAGSSPFYVRGNVYLAGPYKGAPLSLAFIVPAVAGPFDLGVQVVRAAVGVDPKSAQITTVSDPIPQILRGVPLRLRDIRVDIDRPSFALNPTDCAEQLVAGTVYGSHGAATSVSNRFQVAECARLAFKPRTNIRLFGGIGRGAYQGVRAVVRPRPGDANIDRAVVRFPRTAFVAQEHLKDICTRVQYAADACPSRSVYGRAVAWSPLLDYPLTGSVYLRSSDNTLPDLVADLRGPAHQPIRIEVAVRNDSVKGVLRNTVQSAPDTPVSYFRLQTFGKAKGLIVNSSNICKGKNRAWVGMKAHNGRRAIQRVAIFNKRCKAYKRKLRAQKRKAKKRAKHRAHRRAARG